MRRIIYFLGTVLFLSCNHKSSKADTSQSGRDHLISEQSSMENKQLIKYVEAGDTANVKLLLTAENVNTTNGKKQNLLLISTINDDIEMARLLISYGADPNQQSENQDSPFLYAGAFNLLAHAKLFIENGARYDIYNRYNGTALIPAAERGHVEMCRLLANTPNFPINHINRLGWTALMEAVILGDGSQKYVDIVKILLEAGADKNIHDGKGVSVSQHAARMGFDAILTVLNQN